MTAASITDRRRETTLQHDRTLAIRDDVGAIGWPVDVLTIAPDRFERTKNLIGGIACPVNKYGRVL